MISRPLTTVSGLPYVIKQLSPHSLLDFFVAFLGRREIDHDSLTQIGPSFLLSCLNCIAFGTFLAFIYLKTHNIWLAILIHFCNNNLPLMLPQADTWIQATASTLIQLAIFLPFLFSNVFRRAPSP